MYKYKIIQVGSDNCSVLIRTCIIMHLPWIEHRGAVTMVCMWGDQPIKINVVVKVGGGDQYIGGPPRF